MVSAPMEYIFGIFPFIVLVASTRFYFPSIRQIALEKALERSWLALEDSRIPEAQALRIRRALYFLQTDANDIIHEMPPTDSIWKEYRRFFTGLSWRLWKCTRKVRQVRHEIEKIIADVDYLVRLPPVDHLDYAERGLLPVVNSSNTVSSTERAIQVAMPGNST